MSVRPDLPQKRQKTDPDVYSRQTGWNHSEGSLVSSLEAELDHQRSELTQQQASTRSLQVEKERLETMLCRISRTWTKVRLTQLVVELDAALPQEDFVQEVVVTLPVCVDGEGDLQARLERHRQLLRAKVRALLRKERPAQSLAGLHRVVADFAARSFQLEVSCRAAQRAREEAERTCDQLRTEVSSLRKVRREDPTRPYREDVAKLKAELEVVNRARTALEESLSRLQAELHVSDERFVASRSFQRLTRSCQTLFQRLNELNTENFGLKQIQDDMNDRVAAELAKLRKSDERRVEAAETQTREIQRKYEKEVQENALLAGELETLRKLQTHSIRLKETEALLGQREAEIEALKRKLKDGKSARKDLEAQWTQSVTQVEELQQKVASREGELAELKDRLAAEPPADCENSLLSRFFQYREEQTRLRTALRKSEAEITTVANKLTHTHAKLTNEKSAARKLGEDVENTTKAYDQAMRQNKALLQQVKEMEGRETALAAQVQVQQHCKSLHQLELEAVQQKILTRDEVVQAQQAVIVELERSRAEAQTAVVRSKQAEIQGRLRDLERKAKEVERRCSSDLHSFEHNENIKQQATERCRELEKRLIASDTEAAQLRFALSQVDASDGKQHLVAQDSVELKRLVECGVCTARVRDAVIAKCFHSFCRTCLEQCLQTRTADCPACKQSFAQADLRPLYWQ